MRVVLYIILLSVLFATLTQAQHVPYHQYTVDDGLPSNFVYGTTQDEKGYIWVYTDKGIAKFDGYTFQVFNVQEGLAVNDVWYLTEDRQARLWLHSLSKSLTYIKNDTVYNIELPKEVYPKTIRQTPQGVLFLNAHKHDYFFVSDSIQYVSQLNSASIDGFEDYLNTIEQLVKGDEKPSFIGEGIRLKEIRMHYWFKDYIVFRSEKALMWINIKTKESHHISFQELPAFVEFQEVGTSLQVYTNQNLWIFDEALNLIEEIDLSGLAKDKFIYGSFKDINGNRWVGTREDGLLFIGLRQQPTQFLQKGNITSIAALDGDLYVGTASGMLYWYHNDVFEKIGEWNTGVKKMLARKNRGDVLIAIEQDGLFKFDPATNVLSNYEKELQQKRISIDTHLIDKSSIQKHPDPKTLFHYTLSGIKNFVWDNATSSIYQTTYSDVWRYQLQEHQLEVQKVLAKRVTAIANNANGELYLGHTFGLAKYHNAKYVLEEGHPLLQVQVNSMVVDDKSRVWIGTDGYGVYGYDGETVFEVQETKGDIVKDIYIDAASYYWVSTNQGVKQLQIVFGDTLNTRLIRHFQIRDGLPTNAANCVYVDSAYVYIGTSKGIVRIEKDTCNIDSQTLPIYLDEVKIGGVVQAEQSCYALRYPQRVLEISCTALSYQNLGAIEYHYQLTGQEASPQVQKERSFRYENLKLGKYHFSVYAVDDNANKSIPITFDIEVFPPWWASIWFRLLFVGVILGGMYIFYRHRIKKIKAREAERTYFEQQIAGYELEALQAQMNPHFIFNALTTIQYFIKQDNKHLANKYLITFSELTRAFLEASKSRHICLDQELALLKKYIDLEQMRFNEKFDTTIVVDEEVDIYTTEIPSMLLQPFIENAINHGFFHKDNKGHLSIHFQIRKGGGIICTIEDDGIGREQAQQIKATSIRQHKSRATEIVEDRLAVLGRMDNYNIQLEIEDLYDDAQQAAGTRVCIEIPEIV